MYTVQITLYYCYYFRIIDSIVRPSGSVLLIALLIVCFIRLVIILFYQQNKLEFLKFCLIDNFAAIMANKCSAIGCPTSYKGHNTGAVFGLQKEVLKLWWITFLHWNDISKLKNIFICEKHFDDRFLSKNRKRTRLIINKQLFPSILSGTKTKLPTTSVNHSTVLSEFQ